MRFDDTLETVLAGDLGSPSGVCSAWRQLVDLIGRRRFAPDVRALTLLRRIRSQVPLAVRAASAKGLELANPPSALVRLLAVDEVPVAVPVLKNARMTTAEWIQLLPDLAPAGRAVLRNRRDLSPVVRRALESYGPIDFILTDESRRHEAAEAVESSDGAAQLFESTPEIESEPVETIAEAEEIPVVEEPETEPALAAALPLPPITIFSESLAARFGLHSPVVAAPQHPLGAEADPEQVVTMVEQLLRAVSHDPDAPSLDGAAPLMDGEAVDGVAAFESAGEGPIVIPAEMLEPEPEELDGAPVANGLLDHAAPVTEPETVFEPEPEPGPQPAAEAIVSPPISAAPARPMPRERMVDWTDVLAAPTPVVVPPVVVELPRPESRPAPEPVAVEAELPPPLEPVEPAVMEEDFSFVALAGIAAALPNTTIVERVEAQIQPKRDQSGTVGSAVPERSIAEAKPPLQGPDATTSGDRTVLDEGQMLDRASEAPAAAEGDGPFEIAEVVARIDAFWRNRDEGAVDAPVRAVRQANQFRFETDAKGVIRWVDGASRAPIIGLSLDSPAALGGLAGSRVDGVATGAFRRRAGFSNARLAIEGDSDASGDWLISAIPVFDPANGRFTGYRGTARRPRVDERAEPLRNPAAAAPDSLRQLVHELRTPTNAIAGFAEMIETQMLGPVSDPYRERAQVIRAQAKELLGAIDDLDLAARIDSAALSLVPGRVALRPLLATIADDLGPLAALRGSAIALPIADLAVSGDRRAVERLLARLLATLVSASGPDERIGVRTSLDGDEVVSIAIDRPRALSDYPGDSVLGLDDEREDSSLLGTGFALRLARNLARELGGSLVIEPESLTLRLPASVNGQVGQANLS